MNLKSDYWGDEGVNLPGSSYLTSSAGQLTKFHQAGSFADTSGWLETESGARLLARPLPASVEQQTCRHRGRTGDSLYGIRACYAPELTCSPAPTSTRCLAQLVVSPADADPSPPLDS
jgi:hypothetical protein